MIEELSSCLQSLINELVVRSLTSYVLSKFSCFDSGWNASSVEREGLNVNELLSKGIKKGERRKGLFGVKF